MPATPARRPPYAPQFSPRPQPSRTALDRRRRSQHFARRRRDLLEDTAAALLLTLLTVTLTAGLGVVVLIELPVALALIVSYLLDRRRHRRRSRPRPQKPMTHAARTNAGSEPAAAIELIDRVCFVVDCPILMTQLLPCGGGSSLGVSSSARLAISVSVRASTVAETHGWGVHRRPDDRSVVDCARAPERDPEIGVADRRFPTTCAPRFVEGRLALARALARHASDVIRGPGLGRAATCPYE